MLFLGIGMTRRWVGGGGGVYRVRAWAVLALNMDVSLW